jgi:hypothetical protein
MGYQPPKAHTCPKGQVRGGETPRKNAGDCSRAVMSCGREVVIDGGVGFGVMSWDIAGS